MCVLGLLVTAVVVVTDALLVFSVPFCVAITFFPSFLFQQQHLSKSMAIIFNVTRF